MKSKKLFAILTLVAFLMTLLPAAAFAYSSAASSVSATRTSVESYDASDVKTMAKVTVTLKDATGDDETDSSLIYIKSSRDAEAGFVDVNQDKIWDGGDMELYSGIDYGDETGSSIGQGVWVTPVDGEVVFYIGSGVKGSFKVSVYNEDGAEDGILIGSATVTVGSGDGDFDEWVAKDDDGDEDGVDATFDYTGAGTELDPFSLEAGDGLEFCATIKDSGGNAVEGEKVTIKQAKDVYDEVEDDWSFATIGTATTDSDGEISFYYEETVAGDYVYMASVGDNDSEYIYVTVVPGSPDKIIADFTNGKKIATEVEKTFEWTVEDEYGNEIDDAIVNTEFTVTPADSSLEDEEDTAAYVGGDDTYQYSATPDEEGDYTLKASVEDSKISTTLNFTALEFDEATSLKFTLKYAGDEVPAIFYDEDTVSGTLEAVLVDQNGVESEDTNLKFASANLNQVSVDSEDGDLTVEDEDFKGTIAITVADIDEKVTGVFNLKVVGVATGIKPTVTVTDKTAAVDLQYIDEDGEDTFDITDDAETYTIVTPSGLSWSGRDDFGTDGTAGFNLKADAYGKYNVTVVTDNGISKTFAVDFVAPAVPKVIIGAKKVTFFIGATGYVQDGTPMLTDVAPFIKDGRTFVAVKPVAEAFGATAAWNEATKTVTLTRSDMTITIVIGSNVITVVKNGVTSTVTADVAAFISNGRTVLPLRAVAEAFGATVNYDAATGAVTFELKLR